MTTICRFLNRLQLNIMLTFRIMCCKSDVIFVTLQFSMIFMRYNKSYKKVNKTYNATGMLIPQIWGKGCSYGRCQTGRD